MTGREVMIESLGVDHLEDVAVIMQSAFDPKYGEAWNPAQTLSVLALPGYALRGAFIDAGAGNSLAGFAITRTVAGESELLLLAVNAGLQRRGVGAALLGDWIDFSRRQSVERLFLEVRADNPALNLYLSSGFLHLATRPGYYRGGDGQMRDALTMQLFLHD